MNLALAEWKGRVSPVFDVSRHILVVNIKDGVIVDRREELFDEEEPIRKAKKLALMEIDHLICGAISRPLAGIISAYGITIIPFVAGDVEEVLKAFISGLLPAPSLSMPGCCGKKTRFCLEKALISTKSQPVNIIKDGRRKKKRKNSRNTEI
ncbi:MAG TPA: NifB/NifX family molybdenum-iron cluster-binding protein [Desulfobacteraceae bacterium]|nr:NifB/NifX family molybdenum-iron cluster-binding protein [Desulfobacteraceae bacterium]HPJ69094.1 NifB/NifX family molybdenum-iron cluster-binding protein [Desulfobacteraceae bacterium]HPQ29690.1 NifB/NifX family molybdenum-iron cluster-binding protein [Desulfobacteraceae bacterium]